MTTARITRIGRWMDRWRFQRLSAASCIADAAVAGYPTLEDEGVALRYEVARRAHDTLLNLWRDEWDRLQAEHEGAA